MIERTRMGRGGWEGSEWRGDLIGAGAEGKGIKGGAERESEREKRGERGEGME